MPWIDLIIILLITLAAFIGYNVGLFGAFKGFISKIAGWIVAWFATPFIQAWLETKWGVESFLAILIEDRIPASLQEVVRGLAQTSRSLQEVREKLLTASLPPEIAEYLQRTMSKVPAETVPSPDMIIRILTQEIAQSLLKAFLFVLIWMILSILIKGFISMIFVSDERKTILGVFDGILGMVAMTFILMASLVIFSGLLYPVILLSGSGGALAKIIPYLLDSRMISWMGGLYQFYVVPRIGG